MTTTAPTSKSAAAVYQQLRGHLTDLRNSPTPPKRSRASWTRPRPKAGPSPPRSTPPRHRDHRDRRAPPRRPVPVREPPHRDHPRRLRPRLRQRRRVAGVGTGSPAIWCVIAVHRGQWISSLHGRWVSWLRVSCLNASWTHDLMTSWTRCLTGLETPVVVVSGWDDEFPLTPDSCRDHELRPDPASRAVDYRVLPLAEDIRSVFFSIRTNSRAGRGTRPPALPAPRHQWAKYPR